MPRAKKSQSTEASDMAEEPMVEPAAEAEDVPEPAIAPRATRVTNDEPRAGQQPRRQMKLGRVVSEKMDKTVIVAVEYTREHRLYKKAMKRTSKFAAHDERNECHVGDMVRIEETRPLSKTKHWIVREVVQRRVVI